MDAQKQDKEQRDHKDFRANSKEEAASTLHTLRFEPTNMGLSRKTDYQKVSEIHRISEVGLQIWPEERKMSGERIIHIMRS